MYIYRIFATPETILFQGHRPVSDQHWRLASPLLCDVIWDWQLSAEHKSFLKLMEPKKKGMPKRASEWWCIKTDLIQIESSK